MEDKNRYELNNVEIKKNLLLNNLFFLYFYFDRLMNMLLRGSKKQKIINPFN